MNCGVRFQSTRPVRGATCIFRPSGRSTWFQSTRPVRGATKSCRRFSSALAFQSTRPVRGATFFYNAQADCPVVSIHAPRAGRDIVTAPTIGLIGVSIHAPRAGRDPPLGYCLLAHGVSIHAPRAGRDRSCRTHAPMRRCFNPRAPCGARPLLSDTCPHATMFQSTRPVRGATSTIPVDITMTDVSIHAPRAGRDYGFYARYSASYSFNPRAPCGARRTILRHSCTA